MQAPRKGEFMADINIPGTLTTQELAVIVELKPQQIRHFTKAGMTHKEKRYAGEPLKYDTVDCIEWMLENRPVEGARLRDVALDPSLLADTPDSRLSESLRAAKYSGLGVKGEVNFDELTENRVTIRDLLQQDNLMSLEIDISNLGELEKMGKAVQTWIKTQQIYQEVSQTKESLVSVDSLTSIVSKVYEVIWRELNDDFARKCAELTDVSEARRYIDHVINRIAEALEEVTKEEKES